MVVKEDVESNFCGAVMSLGDGSATVVCNRSASAAKSMHLLSSRS